MMFETVRIAARQIETGTDPWQTVERRGSRRMERVESFSERHTARDSTDSIIFCFSAFELSRLRVMNNAAHLEEANMTIRFDTS